MMRKKLILLGALALTHSIIWNVSRLRADVFEDLNRVYQAYQANPNDPQVAASYVRLFDTLTNDMGNIYSAHGGGGVLGFEGSCEEGGLADGVLTQRGNVRSYPFLLGCWLNNFFHHQRVVWIAGIFTGINYSAFLNGEQKAELAGCCYCGAPAWKACCCDCCPYDRSSCCCNALLCITTCGLLGCMDWWPNKDTAKAYFMAEMGEEIKQYLYNSFRVRSLREVGNALQRYFVRPVAEILLQACDSRNAGQINFETFFRTVNLYRCYVGSDFGNHAQTRFAQYDFDNVRDRFHTWLFNVMQVQRREEDPIHIFFVSTLTHWHNNVYRYIDRDSLPDTPIHPLGWYQIELLLLKNKLLEMVALRGETQHPLLLLLTVKSRELEQILEPNRAEEVGAAMRRGAGV